MGRNLDRRLRRMEDERMDAWLAGLSEQERDEFVRRFANGLHAAGLLSFPVGDEAFWDWPEEKRKVCVAECGGLLTLAPPARAVGERVADRVTHAIDADRNRRLAENGRK